MHLANAQAQRVGVQRIFLLLTDARTHYRGDGTAFSQFTMPEIISELKAGGVIIHTLSPNVSLAAPLMDNNGQPALMSLANPSDADVKILSEETGGIWQNVSNFDPGPGSGEHHFSHQIHL